MSRFTVGTAAGPGPSAVRGAMSNAWAWGLDRQLSCVKARTKRAFGVTTPLSPLALGTRRQDVKMPKLHCDNE
jgi:hypothetical protein